MEDDRQTLMELRRLDELTKKASGTAPIPPPSNGEDAGPLAAFGESLADAVPFGQRITSGIGALGAAAMGAGNVRDLYNQAQDNTQATSDANPNASLAGTITGIIPTLGIGGGLAKFASAPVFDGVGAMSKIGNTLGQMVKGAATSAPVGAIYAAGTAPTIQDMPDAAINGAEFAGALGAGTPILGAAAEGIANTYKGALARNIDQLDLASSALKDKVNATYKSARDIGAVLHSNAADEFVGKINNAVSSDGLLNSKLHGDTLSVLTDLSNASKSGNLGLESIDQHRQLLNDVIDKNTDITGKLNPDARKALVAKRSLDAAVKNIKQPQLSNGSSDAFDLLVQGRQQYAQNAKFDDLLRIAKKADGDPNKLKRGLLNYANNDKKTAGFSDSEFNDLKEASANSAGELLLKMAGKFGIDLGSVQGVGNTAIPAFTAATGATLAGLTGGAAGGGAIPLIASGTAARQAQKWIAKGKFETLMKNIERK